VAQHPLTWTATVGCVLLLAVRCFGQGAPVTQPTKNVLLPSYSVHEPLSEVVLFCFDKIASPTQENWTWFVADCDLEHPDPARRFTMTVAQIQEREILPSCAICGHRYPGHYKNCPYYRRSPGEGPRTDRPAAEPVDMDPDVALNMMSPVTVPIFCTCGVVAGMWNGARWWGKSVFGESPNYFTFLDDQLGFKVIASTDPKCGWQFQLPRVFNWAAGSPFLVAYGVPWLIVKGGDALIPDKKPDPHRAEREKMRGELATTISESMNPAPPTARRLREQAREALAAANTERVPIDLKAWNPTYRLEVKDVPLPKLSRASVEVSGPEFRSGLAKLDGACRHSREEFQKFFRRFGRVIGDDLKSKAADYVDATLSRAGISIRIGAIYKFREELKGYVDPTLKYVEETLDLAPSVLVYGSPAQEAYLLEKNASFDMMMLRKAGLPPQQGEKR